MKRLFNLYIFSLILIPALAFSGCEAGLTNSSDSSSEKSEIDKFSFSEMYYNIKELKITVASLQTQITASSVKEAELQSEIDTLKKVVAPVGSIQAWHKTLDESLEIPAGWVECNGQVVNDTESDYDGLTVPDLNGEGRFLRGGAVSGELEEDATAVNGLGADSGGSHAHSITEYYQIPLHGTYSFTYRSGEEGNPGSTTTPSGNKNGLAYTNIGDQGLYYTMTTNTTGSHSHSLTGDTETRPSNMSVVWIIRIK
ncbi:MAG: hypothetical protein GY754_01875 [bacterium]|nr:hypothetical protein [bacterium]